MDTRTFERRISDKWPQLTRAEQKAVQFFRHNKEQVLFISASALAQLVGVSDATIIRAVKALGYQGMDQLRQTLGEELRHRLSPLDRLARTLGETGTHCEDVFNVTLEAHYESLEGLRRDIEPKKLEALVDALTHARHIFIFAIGPSSAVADYFVIQLRRFGFKADALTDSGRLLADGLNRIESDDLLISFAYSEVYREVKVALTHARECQAETALITDRLDVELASVSHLILKVARGRADMFSMHTATLALLEILLVMLATRAMEQATKSLTQLNKLRHQLVAPE